MTPDQVEVCLRLLTGHWPRPELSYDEAIVWTRTLATCDYLTAVETIDAIAATGAIWRPTDGVFLADYRSRVGRPTRPAQLPAEPPATPERYLAGIQRCREALRGAGT